jgi:hypothetical protein
MGENYLFLSSAKLRCHTNPNKSCALSIALSQAMHYTRMVLQFASEDIHESRIAFHVGTA